MKILPLIIILMAFTASAQLSTINTTTPLTTNTVTESGTLTIPGTLTNSATFERTNIYKGDQTAVAFGKVNANFDYLSTSVRTNGGTNGQVFVIDKSYAAGGHWTNANFGSGGGGTSNAVPIYDGGATNLTVTNRLTIISSKSYFSFSTVTVTNFQPIINPLIPFYPTAGDAGYINSMTNADGSTITNNNPTTCTNTAGPYYTNYNTHPLTLTNACGFFVTLDYTCTNSDGPYWIDSDYGTNAYTNACGFVIYCTASNIVAATCPSGYGLYSLDSDVRDARWGTLTNSCGFVFVPFSFSSTNTATNMNLQTLLTNVPFWKTNQAIYDLTAYVSGSGEGGTNLMKNYYDHALISTSGQMQNDLMTNAATEGIGRTNDFILQDSTNNWILKYSGYGATSGSYYVPHGIVDVMTRNPGYLFPTIPGFDSPGGGVPYPLLRLTYVVSNTTPIEYTVPSITNWFDSKTVTNIDTATDWFIGAPNDNGSFTIVQWNPNGQFNWLTNWPNTACTIYPAAPFYSAPGNPSDPNYLSESAGACWVILVNGQIIQSCNGNLPIYWPFLNQ